MNIRHLQLVFQRLFRTGWEFKKCVLAITQLPVLDYLVREKDIQT